MRDNCNPFSLDLGFGMGATFLALMPFLKSLMMFVSRNIFFIAFTFGVA